MATQTEINKIRRDMDKLNEELMFTSKPDKVIERLNEMYTFLKAISPILHSEEGGISKFYYVLRAELASLEDFKLPFESIITMPKIDITYPDGKPDTKDHEAILNYIVSVTRNAIYRKLTVGNRSKIPLEETDLANECYDCAWYSHDVAKDLGLEAKVLTIQPGFNPMSYGQGMAHCCTVIEIDSIPYLVDCTYSQFFWTKRCLSGRLGLMEYPGPAPGAFMVIDPERKKIAETILKQGWIENTPSVYKAYMDGFALCYRNGLYYEDTKDFTFRTSYTKENYDSFFSYDDDQFNHEKGSHLCFQKRPLKDPHIKIPL